MKEESGYIRLVQQVVLIASSLLVLFVVIAWIVSGPAREWKAIQRDYVRLADAVPDTLAVFDTRIERGIHELNIAGLRRTDRCVTCHMGVENPAMETAAQPHTAHPASFFDHHPPDGFGCTICHHGQGRALNSAEAHATEAGVHWDRPVLPQPYIQSSCGTCHLSVFTPGAEFEGAETFLKGQEIFDREGCLGCHRARGVGGILGPDLTEQGEKTRSEYDFRYIDAEQTVSNWLKEHFRDPEMVSPGSRMLKIDLPEADLDALSTFVLGLTKPEIDLEYFSLNTLEEFKGVRDTLMPERAYSMICSGCHGKVGEGKSYSEYETGVPGIGRTDFRRVVSSDYIKFTLLNGRSRRQMASWSERHSGLMEKELTDVADRLQSPAGDTMNYRESLFRSAYSQTGRKLFSNHCATCHGEEGSGGVALALNQVDLVGNATDAYLFLTLITGRGNAGMPSWENLAEEEIYGLVSYMRSWYPYAPQRPSVSFAGTDPQEGKLNYHFLCSRCHGESGQGQTGPSIINRDFLEVADDTYLYNVVAFGREHTAMFGWSTDVYNNERLDEGVIGDIVAFLRTEAAAAPAYIEAGRNIGDAGRGRELYWNHCAECHGEQGEGPNAPALNNQELLNAASNGYLVATVTVGRDGTEMPAWGMAGGDHAFLSGSDRQDVVAYIRNWQRIRIKFNRE